MAFNGSGTYVLPGAALVDGQTISATEHNTLRNDMATALTTCVTRDGQSPATANIPMGGFKLTGLAAGSGNGESVRFEQLIATAIVNTPAGSIAATTVQAAINELDTEKAALAGSASQNFAANDLTVSSINTGQVAGMRNIIINGDFQVAQRSGGSTPVALTTTAAYATADRWAVLQEGTANGISAAPRYDNTSPPEGFATSFYMGRNNGAVTTGFISATQVVETYNSKRLAGSTVTLSWYARAGANFSATSSLMSIAIFTGTGIDQSLSSVLAGSWTSQATLSNTTQAITASFVRYSVTVAVPSNVTQLAVRLGYTPTGTSGADDVLYLGGVQLELGTKATPFEHLDREVVLAQCQRYYFRKSPGTTGAYLGGWGNCTSTTASTMGIPFPVTMRIAPTALEQSGTANQYSIFQSGIGATVCSSVPTFTAADTGSAIVNFTVASGLTQFNPTRAITDVTNGASAYLAWSAEL